LHKTNGCQVVLTADRTLTADYPLLFDGMVACSQTTTVPTWLAGRMLMPGPRSSSAGARVAPMGLRRIEAALVADGFATEDIVITDYENLPKAIGPATRIVGVSSGEPLGLGMNSSTMTAVAGGRIYPATMFEKLMKRVRRLIERRAPSAKVVLGGPGAWQLASGEPRRKAGIDHIITGYAEGNAAEVFHRLVRGEPSPRLIKGRGLPAAEIPPIRGAAAMGVVEVSRGCGLGCSFCTIGRVPMTHLPEKTIVADTETNVAAGVTSISALSEDFFRYGGSGGEVCPTALISLLSRLREVAGLRLIQIDHANIVSVSRFRDEELKAVHELLLNENRGGYPWVNVGVETAAGRLLQRNGGGAKMGDCPPEEWSGLCARQLRRLCRVGFFPMASLMIGLPGETEDDVRATIEWTRALRGERVAVFPMLYAPINGARAPDARDLGPHHWQLIRTCYEFNFKWVPRMYRDNQAAAGVRLSRRCLTRILGHGQILLWRALLAWRSLNAKAGAQNAPGKTLTSATE